MPAVRSVATSSHAENRPGTTHLLKMGQESQGTDRLIVFLIYECRVPESVIIAAELEVATGVEADRLGIVLLEHLPATTSNRSEKT